MTVTALCKGCSYWAPFGSEATVLDGNGENYLAFAFSQIPVDDPADPETTFGIHDRVGHWIQNFADAKSSEFATWAGTGAAPGGQPATTAQSSNVSITPTTGAGSGEQPAPTTAESASMLTTSVASQMTLSTSVMPSAPAANGSSALTPPVAQPIAEPAALPIPTQCEDVPAPLFPLGTAPGWGVTKLAGGYRAPRGMAVDAKGNLLVIDSGRGLIINTLGANGCFSSSKLLINNPLLNHGISLTPDGKTLVVTSKTTAFLYNYDADTQTVSDEKIVVKGMINGGHPSRSTLIPPATPHLLLIQLGSYDNLDMPSLKMETARAVVKVFDLSKAPAEGYDYVAEGWFLGYGLRNDIALVADGNNM
jgi:hypothetical protein